MANCNDNSSSTVKSRDIAELEKVYEITELLGSGRFGTVHTAKQKDTGKEFAAKNCVCRRPSQRKDVELEIELMNLLKHDKLVQLVDTFVSKKEVVLIMELITGGELFDRIIDESFDLTEELASGYVKQVCEGVGFIHSNMVLHLDLKPENILCLHPQKLDQVKIIDFGFARKYTPGAQLKVMFGTPEFVAPEVVNFDPLGPGTDMWSIGVITYVLLSGLSPFMGEDDLETLSNVTGCEWDFEEDCFKDISDNAKNFIETILHPKENMRASCVKCLQHPWISGEAMKTDRKMSSKLSLITAVEHLRKFVNRRKWARSINAVRAINRFQTGAKKNGDNASPDRKKVQRTRELMGK
uniref:myosin light chain kinase, smooth muscle-like n=1 Tax=Styela clava TaxID=7725 RepID=UPI001939CA7C|nr:myosin light chain kinase, smooth muscle-like [Styela clava]